MSDEELRECFPYSVALNKDYIITRIDFHPNSAFESQQGVLYGVEGCPAISADLFEGLHCIGESTETLLL